jgi:hypothetical protein
MPGETVLMKMKLGDCFFASAALRCEPNVPAMVPGEFVCTTYQLHFFPADSYDFPPGYFDVPLAAVRKVELHSTKNGRKVLICLKCKDLRTLVFGFRDESTRTKAHQTLSTLAFPNKVSFSFCFYNGWSPAGSRGTRLGGVPPSSDGAIDGANDATADGGTPPRRVPRLPRLPGGHTFSWANEHARLGALAPGSPFVRSMCNDAYKMSPTYPRAGLLRPRDFGESSMWQVAAFRSKGRIPGFTWCFPGRPDGPTLWRCSQPKVGPGILGAGGNRNREDEGLFSRVRLANRRSQRLLIADCRSKTAAYANAMKGYGVESPQHYANATVRFLGIGNIHKMRASLAQLGTLLQSTPSPSTDLSWLKAVEDTEWPYHVRNVLSGAVSVAKTLYLQEDSVVVHCSDGWDRTAQICSLVQLLLDPDARTLEGFLRLVQKEWLGWGHKFQERIGHAQRHDHDRAHECSPVFLQYLDCAWQLLRQYPACFEFGPRLLSTLAHHLYSCAFGDFLGNNERERAEMELDAKTPSLFDWIVDPSRRSGFLNPLYRTAEAAARPGSGLSKGEPNGSTVLLPYRSTLVRNYAIWSDYFYRWCSVPTWPSQIPPLSRPEGTLTTFRSVEARLLERERAAGESADGVEAGRVEAPDVGTNGGDAPGVGTNGGDAPGVGTNGGDAPGVGTNDVQGLRERLAAARRAVQTLEAELAAAGGGDGAAAAAAAAVVATPDGDMDLGADVAGFLDGAADGDGRAAATAEAETAAALAAAEAEDIAAADLEADAAEDGVDVDLADIMGECDAILFGDDAVGQDAPAAEEVAAEEGVVDV